jgi:putative nucleotidyltransferase with HDIG domain
MDYLTLPAAAAALSKDLRRLTACVVDHLQDPALIGDPALESSMELLLDRLCLSIQVAKPVGLATWAVREGRRLGSARACEIADAAAHVIVTEAARFHIDERRLFALLEVLKSEIHGALAALGDRSRATTSNYPDATHALLSMLDERDSQTCGHSKATAEWARRLSESMGLPAEQAAFIELCAILHDVGKIGTPESILLKPAALDATEWEIMREHSAAGERILRQIPSLASCAPIVRGHHERWDGAGYPDALAGQQIPFEARIVAVADAFHAMISDRPYRAAIPPRRALEILQAGSGTQWDPFVVDAMLELLQGKNKRGQVQEQRASTA